MRLLQLILRVLVNTYFTSADPNLFGSRRRRLGKEKIAGEYKLMAQGTQDQIDQVQSENPFESAGAKAAMAQASRGAKQMQTRMLNTMGANGSTAESIVATQGATNEALGSAVGEIAAGAEANKSNKLHSLQSQKNQQMGMYGGMGSSAASEYGSGWGTAFQAMDSIGKVVKGGAEAAAKVLPAVI